MQPLIINAAITGMVPTRQDSPFVPITPREIIADVRECIDAGASVIHVHARHDDGTPAYEREIYAEIFAGIRALDPEVVVSGSTSGRVFGEFSQRSEVLTLDGALRPDLGSLTLGSLNFPRTASVNAPDMIQALARAMQSEGIVPEWELFDLGMIDYARFLVDRGVLVRPYYANILLGSLGTLSASAYHLALMVQALPEGTVWSATGIGRFQFFVNSLAIAMGGHVRVGLEDNLYYDSGKTRLANNAELIERVARVAGALGRDIATPAETREIIGLPSAATPQIVSFVRAAQIAA
jgi:3-keto-5-aminohexanoate cleavage enzyme